MFPLTERAQAALDEADGDPQAAVERNEAICTLMAGSLRYYLDHPELLRERAVEVVQQADVCDQLQSRWFAWALAL